ncbi:MAG TPA: Thivi_2564 family membrane protein [Methylococcales bacterium]
MSIISVIIILTVIGVLLWLVNTYLASMMDGKILKIINIVVVVLVILWVLSLFFDFGTLEGFRTHRIN